MTSKSERFEFTDVERQTFAEEFAEKRRMARLAESKILDCPEFAGCLTEREATILKLWSEDLPERELLEQLTKAGNKIGRDTLYREIKSALSRLRARVRRFRKSQVSPDLQWILALISARESEGDGWDIVWTQQIQEKVLSHRTGVHV